MGATAGAVQGLVLTVPMVTRTITPVVAKRALVGRRVLRADLVTAVTPDTDMVPAVEGAAVALTQVRSTSPEAEAAAEAATGIR
jgi:hypothetical protein